jgi:signal transduction histidine kinase
MKGKAVVRTLVHDARAPLNRISMNAELIKLVLENDMPKDKALSALEKIINNCQQCSVSLQKIADLDDLE